MGQLIDSGTGNIVTPDDAWERHERIVGLRNEIEENFLTLGRELHVFHTKRQYETVGYDTFEKYLADPEVDLSRRSAMRSIAVYRHYTLNLECATVALLKVGVVKAELLIPHTTRENVKMWLTKAAAMSRSTLEAELKEGKEDKPHIAQSTGNNEWYTPPEYVEAARSVMGEIDLDPASSDLANKIVRATAYYTEGNDGLLYDWEGRVWMNPPYASHLIGLFTGKLAEHVQKGDVPQACVLVNNATETEWFRVLARQASCVCFPAGRIRFLSPSGEKGAPLQGQAILYCGPNASAFADAFSVFGMIFYVRSTR